MFKDHTDDICSLNFYCDSQKIDNEIENKYVLASASDDGTIKLYFEEDYSKIHKL